MKAAQAATEKRMIALQQETFQKIQYVQQPNVNDNDMKGIYSGRSGDNKHNNNNIVVNGSSALFDADADDDDSDKNDYETN